MPPTRRTARGTFCRCTSNWSANRAIGLLTRSSNRRTKCFRGYRDNWSRRSTETLLPPESIKSTTEVGRRCSRAPDHAQHDAIPVHARRESTTAMRHSNSELTMQVYTDPRLLDAYARRAVATRTQPDSRVYALRQTQVIIQRKQEATGETERATKSPT